MKHFDIGKLFGFALLGLQAFAAQDQPGAGPKIFLDPAVVGQLMGGVLSVLGQHATTPATPAPAAVSSPVANIA